MWMPMASVSAPKPTAMGRKTIHESALTADDTLARTCDATS